MTMLVAELMVRRTWFTLELIRWSSRYPVFWIFYFFWFLLTRSLPWPKSSPRRGAPPVCHTAPSIYYLFTFEIILLQFTVTFKTIVYHIILSPFRPPPALWVSCREVASGEEGNEFGKLAKFVNNLGPAPRHWLVTREVTLYCPPSSASSSLPQNYLDSLVEVDNDLGRVAAEEDHHDRHQQASHRAVPAQLDYHTYFNIQRTENYSIAMC